MDAIVTDPPYGVRAGARKSVHLPHKTRVPGRDHFPHTDPYTLAECLADLLESAARMLRLGGRLVYFLPVTSCCRILLRIPLHKPPSCLSLHCNAASSWGIGSSDALTLPCNLRQTYCLVVQVVPEKYDEAVVPSHPALEVLHNCEQILTDRYRWGALVGWHRSCCPVHLCRCKACSRALSILVGWCSV